MREAPDRDIKQLIKRLAIEKAQAENRKAPQEALRTQLEIDKLYKELMSPHRVSVQGRSSSSRHLARAGTGAVSRLAWIAAAGREAADRGSSQGG